jgi:WD40 repeat protein
VDCHWERGRNRHGVWDVNNGYMLVTLKGHTGPVRSVAFSPDGKRIVAGSGSLLWAPGPDSTARVWDAASGRLLFKLQGHNGPAARLLATHRQPAQNPAPIDHDDERLRTVGTRDHVAVRP